MIFDLHVHASIPVLGDWWRRRIQDFQPAILETDSQAELAGYGLACYETYVLRPEKARLRLFAALEAVKTRGVNTLLQAEDAAALEAAAAPALLLAVESMRYLRDPSDVRRLWDLGV